MAKVPGFDDVLGMLRMKPGMWKPLATDSSRMHAEMLRRAMASAADEEDPGEIYEFEWRQTDENEFTVFGRFDGPGDERWALTRS